MPKYECAPEAFMLITDEAAVVEQHHYGKVKEEPGGRILGGAAVPERLSREEMQFDIIAGFLLDLCDDTCPVTQVPDPRPLDKDRQVEVAPVIGPALDL